MKKPDQAFRQLAALYEFSRGLQRFKLPARSRSKPGAPAPTAPAAEEPRRVHPA